MAKTDPGIRMNEEAGYRTPSGGTPDLLTVRCSFRETQQLIGGFGLPSRVLALEATSINVTVLGTPTGFHKETQGLESSVILIIYVD